MSSYLQPARRTARLQVDQGSYNLRNHPLPQLMLKFLDQRKTGVLLIEREGEEGAVYLVNGFPRHAICGELSGMEAVSRFAFWTGGFARWRDEFETAHESLHANDVIRIFQKMVQTV